MVALMLIIAITATIMYKVSEDMNRPSLVSGVG